MAISGVMGSGIDGAALVGRAQMFTEAAGEAFARSAHEGEQAKRFVSTDRKRRGKQITTKLSDPTAFAERVVGSAVEMKSAAGSLKALAQNEELKVVLEAARAGHLNADLQKLAKDAGTASEAAVKTARLADTLASETDKPITEKFRSKTTVSHVFENDGPFAADGARDKASRVARQLGSELDTGGARLSEDAKSAFRELVGEPSRTAHTGASNLAVQTLTSLPTLCLTGVSVARVKFGAPHGAVDSAVESARQLAERTSTLSDEIERALVDEKRLNAIGERSKRLEGLEQAEQKSFEETTAGMRRQGTPEDFIDEL